MVPLDSAELDDNDIENLYIHKFDQDSVYFVTGKFTMLNNGLLELVVSSCKCLPIDKDKVPVCKPIVYLLDRVKDACKVTDSGYYMTMEVKPYLAAEMCGPVNVVLTHPSEGRLKILLPPQRSYLQSNAVQNCLLSKTSYTVTL